MTAARETIDGIHAERLTALLRAVRGRLQSGHAVRPPHGGPDDVFLELRREDDPKRPDKPYTVATWRRRGSRGDSPASVECERVVRIGAERVRAAVRSAIVDRGWIVPDDWIAEADRDLWKNDDSGAAAVDATPAM